MPTILSNLISSLRALSNTLLSNLQHLVKVLLEHLFACLAKLYTWDLEANIPQAPVVEIELRTLGGIRALLAELDLLASRSPPGLAMATWDELDDIRNQQEGEDWETWEGWEEEEEEDEYDDDMV